MFYSGIMQFVMTPDEYIDLVNKINNLISLEIDRAFKDSENLPMIYPKIITMYEFFRLLRGESFTDFRPPTENQKDFYHMEDKLSEKIKELKNKIDFNDGRVKLYIEETQKYYLK